MNNLSRKIGFFGFTKFVFHFSLDFDNDPLKKSLENPLNSSHLPITLRIRFKDGQNNYTIRTKFNATDNPIINSISLILFFISDDTWYSSDEDAIDKKKKDPTSAPGGSAPKIDIGTMLNMLRNSVTSSTTPASQSPSGWVTGLLYKLNCQESLSWCNLNKNCSAVALLLPSGWINLTLKC